MLFFVKWSGKCSEIVRQELSPWLFRCPAGKSRLLRQQNKRTVYSKHSFRCLPFIVSILRCKVIQIHFHSSQAFRSLSPLHDAVHLSALGITSPCFASLFSIGRTSQKAGWLFWPHCGFHNVLDWSWLRDASAMGFLCANAMATERLICPKHPESRWEGWRDVGDQLENRFLKISFPGIPAQCCKQHVKKMSMFSRARHVDHKLVLRWIHPSYLHRTLKHRCNGQWAASEKASSLEWANDGSSAHVSLAAGTGIAVAAEVPWRKEASRGSVFCSGVLVLYLSCSRERFNQWQRSSGCLRGPPYLPSTSSVDLIWRAFQPYLKQNLSQVAKMLMNLGSLPNLLSTPFCLPLWKAFRQHQKACILEQKPWTPLAKAPANSRKSSNYGRSGNLFLM